MSKAGSTVASDTQSRLVDAALKTIKSKGFSGSTARAIGERARLNQALIYYHFGNVNNLLLAALDETSRKRMETYEGLLDESTSIEDLVRTAARIYHEDLKAGHITVLAELIAGSLKHRELGPKVVRRLRPWIDFAERAIRKVSEGTFLEQLIPPRQLALAVVSFYLGIDLLHQLDHKAVRVDDLFDSASKLAPLASNMLSSLSGGK